MVTDLVIALRPVPVPTGRPAPFRAPPCVFVFFMSVEVKSGTEMLVGVAEVTRKGVNAEIDFPARVFAPAILPPSPAESEDFFACGGFEVFNIESFHGVGKLEARGSDPRRLWLAIEPLLERFEWCASASDVPAFPIIGVAKVAIVAFCNRSVVAGDGDLRLETSVFVDACFHFVLDLVLTRNHSESATNLQHA